MSSPSYYDDGSFVQTLQNGPVRYAFPFVDKGDPATFTAVITKRQDARYVLPPQLMFSYVFNPGKAYLVGRSETRDVGNGILEWDDTYSSLPSNRSEYGSISYTQQRLTQNTLTAERNIQEFTSTKDARYFYEYSLNTPKPRILAPLLVLFGNVIYPFGGWGTYSDGQEILAQDTTSEIYMGKIYVRKSIFVRFNQFITLT